MIIRPLTIYDNFYISTNSHIQLAMRCKKESYIERVLHNLKKMAVGTRLRIENGHLIIENREIPVYRLPNSIRTPYEATNYVALNHVSNPSISLATISANDSIVAINSHHLCFDGGIALEIFNGLRDNIDVKLPQKVENIFDVFSIEIEKAKHWSMIDAINPELTRVRPRDKIGLFQKNSRSITTTFSDTKNLKCYNEKTEKVHMLTDALYAQIILASSAFEGAFKAAGVKTMINMRPFIKDDKNPWENGVSLSKITVNANDATFDTTVGNLMNMFRNDFNKSLKEGKHFGYLKKYHEKPPKNKKIIPGTFFVLSNVGQFKLGGPFDDVHLRTSGGASDYFPSISFLHFAKIGENKNQAFSSFSYQPSKMTKREADLLLNSVHYGLENVSLNITMAEAIDKIKDFQNEFVDNKYNDYLFK